MIRKWVLVAPSGKKTRWRTYKYAVTHAKVCFVEEQAKKVRRTLSSLRRKHGIRFKEDQSPCSESYYFVAWNWEKKDSDRIKIRISAHPTKKENDFQIVCEPVDICSLRSKLRKILT